MMDGSAAIYELSVFMDRLANIDRYAMWEKNHRVNVAEHSFRVAMLCMVIADSSGVELNKEELLRKALLHDFGESIMGDVSYLVKHANPQTEKMFDELENSYIEKVFESFDEHFKNLAIECKKNEEGKIVAIADMLDNILYGSTEIRMGNLTHIVLINRCVPLLRHLVSGTPYEFVMTLCMRIKTECEKYLDEPMLRFLEERHGLRP